MADDPQWSDAPPVSFGRRITQLAEAHPDAVAIHFAPLDGDVRAVTWKELDQASNRAARALIAAGATSSSRVVIGLPNGIEHVVAALGAWKVGACAVPLRWDLPEWERDRVLAVARPDVIVAEWPNITMAPQLRREWLADDSTSAAPLPDVVATPARAIASSGSTGTPKIIQSNRPGEAVPGQSLHNPTAVFMGQHAGQVVLVPAPLYHTNGFLMLHSALFEGQTAVLMQ